MRKTIAFMIAAVILFTACKKDEQEFLTPVVPKVGLTLKNNQLFPNTVMVGVKTDTVVASITMNPNDLQGLYPMGSSISFLYSGAFKPSTGYKNIYFIVKGPANFNFRSETKATVVDAENSFNQWFRNFNSNTNYLIEIHADVTSQATDGVSPDDQCSIIFSLIYRSDGNDQNKTLSDTAQMLTFSRVATSVLETSIDPLTPVTQTVTGNQEINLLTMRMKSIGGSSNIDKQNINLNDLNASGAVSVVKIYDTASGVSTLVGSGTVSGQVSIVTLNLNMPENVEKTFLVKAVIGNVTSNISGSVLSATSDKVFYKDAGGAQKVNDIDRTSNDFTIFKSILKIEKVAVPTLLITNNSIMEFYRFKATAIGGNAAIKQPTFEITLSDQGVNDTLFKKTFQVFEDGVDVTSSYRFTNDAGVVDTLFSESDTKLYLTKVSGIGETVISNGSAKTFSFRAFVGGFNHPLDGDGISVVPVSDIVSSDGLKYVNSGGLVSNAKLFSSPSANSGAQAFNFIWSDMSSSSHSGQFGLSSNDWYGGQKVFTSLTPNIFHQ